MGGDILFRRPRKGPIYRRAHYEDMADVARQSNDPSLTDRLVHMFSTDNPRFSEDKFRERARKKEATDKPSEGFDKK